MKINSTFFNDLDAYDSYQASNIIVCHSGNSIDFMIPVFIYFDLIGIGNKNKIITQTKMAQLKCINTMLHIIIILL